MCKRINLKTHRLFYAWAMILIFSLAAAAQPAERIVDWHPRLTQGSYTAAGCGLLIPTETAALELIEIKIGEQPVRFGQPFSAGEEWLKNLSVKVKNVSGKPISSIRIGFNLPEAKFGETTMGFSLSYQDPPISIGAAGSGRRVIEPGEEIVLSRNEAEYARDAGVIAQKSGAIDFSRAMVGLTLVKFADGRIWSSGKLPPRGETAGVKTALAKQSGHQISGTVTMQPDAAPVAGAVVEIRSLDNRPNGTPFFRNCTFTDAAGRWAIDEVPDGEHLVVIDPASRFSGANDAAEKISETDAARRVSFIAKAFRLKVAGTGIADLATMVNRGGKIAGKVIMDDGAPLPKDLIVLPEQLAETGRAPGRIAPVQPDGSFLLEGVPVGDIRLKAVVYGKVNEYYVKSAAVNGIDLLSQPLAIQDGVQIKDVRIVFARAVK